MSARGPLRGSSNDINTDSASLVSHLVPIIRASFTVANEDLGQPYLSVDGIYPFSGALVLRENLEQKYITSNRCDYESLYHNLQQAVRKEIECTSGILKRIIKNIAILNNPKEVQLPQHCCLFLAPFLVDKLSASKARALSVKLSMNFKNS